MKVNQVLFLFPVYYIFLNYSLYISCSLSILFPCTFFSQIHSDFATVAKKLWKPEITTDFFSSILFFPVCFNNKKKIRCFWWRKKNVVNLSSRLKINNSSMVWWKKQAKTTYRVCRFRHERSKVIRQREYGQQKKKTISSRVCSSTIVTGKRLTDFKRC